MTTLRVHGEAGEHDVLKIGIVVALQALVVEAEKSAQCSFGEFQRVKRQQVGLLVKARALDRALAGPQEVLEA
jgi:hypothetical protein